MKRDRIGLHELYAKDPISADRQLWGRESSPLTRRGFLGGAGYAAMTAALGASIPFAEFMPGGLIPAALAQSPDAFQLPGKEGLVVLNDRPINAETPPWLLDDDITPASRLFVRNNGIPPDAVDVDAWRLEIAGEACLEPRAFSIAELKENFEHHTYQLVLECGGNGRSEFNPPAAGNQWKRKWRVRRRRRKRGEKREGEKKRGKGKKARKKKRQLVCNKESCKSQSKKGGRQYVKGER